MKQANPQLTDINTKPSGSNIIFKETDGNLQLTIPPLRKSRKGISTLLLIGIWLTTVLIWTLIVLTMNPIHALFSIPFWLIGIITMVKSLKIVSTMQSIVISSEHVELNVQQGVKKETRQFPLEHVSVQLIEGTYYSLTGLSRQGAYPAIIYNDEAFGFAERASAQEKQWIIQTINNYINK